MLGDSTSTASQVVLTDPRRKPGDHPRSADCVSVLYPIAAVRHRIARPPSPSPRARARGSGEKGPVGVGEAYPRNPSIQFGPPCPLAARSAVVARDRRFFGSIGV